MDEANLEPGRLGDTPGAQRIETLEQLQQVTRALAVQSRYQLDLLSRDLDPPLYDDASFLAAVKTLCTSSRRAQVRVLVADSGPAVRRNQRFLELARRLSSFISIRRLGTEHADCNRALLLADATGYVARDAADRWEAICDFAAPARAVELGREFQAYWDASVADPNFRRLHL